MDNSGRLVAFFLCVLSVWTLMHVYVASRLWNLPADPSHAWHRWLVAIMALLWLSFPVGQILVRTVGRWVSPVAAVGVIWLGVLFLLLVTLLAADLVTGFGWLLPKLLRPARQVALLAAGGLCVVALVQGLRDPVIREYDVAVRHLPAEHAGLRIVQLSDVHLGLLLRTRWLERRLADVERLRPDLIAVTGDVLDQDAELSVQLPPLLRRLRAPLGVWGVTGNHEYFTGLDHSLSVLRESGITMLRDQSASVAPGIVIAGVDDLTARRQFGQPDDAVNRTLRARPPGVTIFLSHSPLEVERAAALGVDLMLSGHTHAGQIWPFTHIVRLMYPYVAGRYDVGQMALIVSRGTGFWGPPMRLFRRAEINVIVLEKR